MDRDKKDMKGVDAPLEDQDKEGQDNLNERDEKAEGLEVIYCKGSHRVKRE